jgi:hypothetical protein
MLRMASLIYLWAPCISNRLHARPILHSGFYMSLAEGRAALALYARIPLFRAQRECGACKDPIDVHGHHALACRSSGMPIRKHNARRDLLVDLHEAAGLLQALEPPGLFVDGKGPDLVVLDDESRLMLLNVTIAVAYTESARTQGYHATAGGGGTVPTRLIQAGQAKNNKYLAACLEADYHFIPMVLDAFGGWSPAARYVIQHGCQTLASASSRWTLASARRWWTQRLSFCSLARQRAGSARLPGGRRAPGPLSSPLIGSPFALVPLYISSFGLILLPHVRPKLST